MSRPGSGVRVGGGKLRVDAARAIDKLRSYQLADPLAWVLEVVRAGVLSPEREAIAVSGSGGDVFVAITCAPPAAEVLPRLFEELVDPSSDPRARGLRLLAMGVNSALGRTEGESSTRHVDVYVIDQEGVCERVRFTPQLFAVERETGISRGLRSLATERVAPPAHAPRPKRGILVHARAVMSLGLLTRWAVGDEPRELAMVRDAAREVRVPITVDGLPVPADPSIVMREPLASGGYVALVAPRMGRVGAVLEAAEGGVVLSREPWACGVGDAAALVPLLLRVDRERLPTNAARSAVRWDEPAAASALEEASQALERLVKRLGKEIDETSDDARLSWLRTIGLTLLAAEVRGVAYRERLAGGVVRGVLAPLLDTKLVYDAVGRRRTPRELARAPETRIHVAGTYAPRDLAPWVGDVLAALPGDPTHLLFGDLPPSSAVSLVEQALVARENQARWLARPIEPARVRQDGDALVRIALPKQRSVRGRPSLVLDGEVVLGLPGTDRTVELRVGGRLLETRRSHAGVGIAAVVSCDALCPSMTFDAAADDDVKKAVLEAIDEAILGGCEAIARLLAGERPRAGGPDLDGQHALAHPASAALVRHAVLALLAGGDVDAARHVVLKKPLGRAPVWTHVNGGAVSLDALASAGAIGVVEKGRPSPEALPTTRPVLVLSDEARTALRLLLPRAQFVDYGRIRARRRSAADLTIVAFERGARVGLAREGAGFASVIAWGESDGGIEAFHVGVRLGSHMLTPVGLPVLLVVDDESIVPDEAWSSTSVDWIALEDKHQLRLGSSRIARAVVRAWLGDVDPALVRAVPLDAPEVVRAVLSQGRIPFEEPLRAEQRSALAALPYLPSLVGGRTSAAEILAENDQRVAYVPSRTFVARDVAGLSIAAMVGSREEAEGLAALVGARGVVDAADRVREAIAAHRRQARLAAIAAQAPETLDLYGTDATTPIRGDGLEGTLGYRPHAGEGRVKLLVDRRPFADLDTDGLPPHVVVKVSIETRLLDDAGAELGPLGLPRVRGAIHASARELLTRLVVERPGGLFGDPALRELADFLVGGGRRRGEVGAMLKALCQPPTLRSTQGTAVSIREVIADDELLALYEPLAHVGPADDETPGPFDRPLALLPWEPSDPRGILLQKIAGVAIRDVTVELRALYAKRRASRGLVPRPSLRRGHEPTLARTIESLMRGTDDETSVLQALGIGVIGLIADRPARARFFVAGEPIHEARLDLVPPFEAALESPLVVSARSLRDDTRTEVEQALARALAQLLRVLADEHAFDGAPDWALDAQRDAALLGGALHLERLGPLRLFPTTAGARVSFEEIRAQQKRFGPVWWTSEPTNTLTPLDPERVALRLSAAHAAALGRAVPVMEGTKELELDRIARTNRALPPVDSIAPTDEERKHALGVEVAQDDDVELVVSVLWPSRALEQELALFLDRRALGTGTRTGDIPVRARARASALVPNRTWTGAIRDETLLAIERRISELAEAAVARSMPTSRGPFPSVTVDAAMMAGVPHPKSRIVRGWLTLGPLEEEDQEEGGVRVIDRLAHAPDEVGPTSLRATAPKRPPHPVPLEGMLVLWGDDRRTAETTLDAVARHAYQRLLGQLAHRVAGGKSADTDLDLAQLIRGAELGFVQPKELRVDVAIPFGRSQLESLRNVVDVLESSSAVVVLTPEQDDATEIPAEIAQHPSFVADDSLAAQRLVLALGPRAISRSDALALALGLREEAGHVSVAPPTPQKKATSESTPTKPAKAAKSAKSAKGAKRSSASAASGPVEPLAARSSAVLQRVGHRGQIVVQASRTEPLVQGTGTVSLAGNNALLALAAGTAVHRERAAVLVAAHVVALGPSAHLALAELARLLG